MEQAHLIISGRVQGVFFRANAQREATRLDLKGWVRNTPDGSVEAVAGGEREVLDKFIEWCRHGPSSAKVQHVDVSWEEAENLPEGFHIRY